MLVARLHRRAGFGLDAAGLVEAAGRGPAAEAARLARPSEAGLAEPTDPFDGVDLTFVKGEVRQRLAMASERWLGRMVDSPRPGLERLAWFWHGHFVAAAPKVKSPAMLADLVRVVWAKGAGPLADLVRAVSVDAAMLLYLDGSGSTKDEPNENYGRELMELFTLGRTAGYTEADVQAAARALTGYRVTGERSGVARVAFDARRHDDSRRTLLGLGGVHDVDTVVRAVTGHPACATHIAGKLARAVLGPGVDAAVVARLAEEFRTGGLDVGGLWAAVLAELAAGTDGGAVVLAPVPWLASAERATGVRLDAKVSQAGLLAAGQVPFVAPNVGGWPSGEAWFSSATVVARFNLAVALGAATPASAPLAVALAGADAAGLGDALGLGAPLGADTLRAVRAVPGAAGRIAVALTSPEFVLA